MAKSKKDVEGGLGIHARRAIAYIVLIIISFFCLFWFYIMFINATRSKGELKAGFTALPSDHLLTNWNNLVHGTLPIWSGMFNSLIIAAATAVLCVYFSTMTAYAIHAYDFKLKKFIYPFILMIMMIPTQVTALGFIKLITGMGLMDSFIPLIVPAWFGGGAFYIFLLRQFYLGIPRDFDEAAYLDGASHIQIFTKIILPITKPALAVVGMFAFLNSWNDFLNPLVYLNSEKKYTVALGLQLFTGSYRGEWNLMMAAACLVLAPVVVVFAIGQKYLIEGVTMSGVKG